MASTTLRAVIYGTEATGALYCTAAWGSTAAVRASMTIALSIAFSGARVAFTTAHAIANSAYRQADMNVLMKP